jgi:Xaa-Pro aminopeptidase
MSDEQISQKSKERVHDQATSEKFGQFMKTGWAPSHLEDLVPLEVVTYAYTRRQVLSAAFPDIRIILPAGNYKVRSNDTDYRYRPHSDFAYYSGVQGSDATADAVLVLEPNADGGHDTYLYIQPRSTRDTEAFYRDTKYGELWVGRRYTLEEANVCYQIETRKVESSARRIS